MFVVEALFDFQPKSLKQRQTNQKKQQVPNLEQKVEQIDENDRITKRKRSQSQERQLVELAEEAQKVELKQSQQPHGQSQEQEKDEEKQEQQQAAQFLSLKKGDKILVEQNYENGWWYGNILKTDKKGFFPSNYIKVLSKPPPPPPQPIEPKEEDLVYMPQSEDLIKKQMSEIKQMEKGAISSEYYQGIKGYKYVKIDDKNKNVLNGNYVKFDAATGLARIPVKDQAPGAKAVRQCGYYFDYHQWNQARNNPEAFQKAKPDASKKKKKKLRLVGMGKDG